jgi:hypothetical protein
VDRLIGRQQMMQELCSNQIDEKAPFIPQQADRPPVWIV